jgi:hypothetical protein
MSNYSDSNHIKIQDDDKIPDDLQKVPYELDRLGNQQEEQTKVEEEDDQKESNESEDETDLDKLIDAMCILPSDDDEDDDDSSSDEEINCDNEYFGDVLKKIKAFKEKNKKKHDKNTIIDAWHIFNDVLNLMKKHETNLTEEGFSEVKAGLEFFALMIHGMAYAYRITTDKIDAKEIFYMYFNLINSHIIQNFLKDTEISDDCKILYHNYTIAILQVMLETSRYASLDLSDFQRPTNCIELLSLLLNYVKIDLKTADLTSISSETTSIARNYILRFIWVYSSNISLIPDLIQAGCVEIMINELTTIYK